MLRPGERRREAHDSDTAYMSRLGRRSRDTMPDVHAEPSAELRALLSPAQGVVGLAARHVESGRVWRWNERRPFPAASLIKLFVHAAFEAAVEQESVDPDERTRVPADAYVGGTGVLRALAPGLEPTWRDLVTLMVTVSDNTATNLVLDRLGMGRVHAWIARAGLDDTRLERRMMDLAAGREGRNNWTSAADVAALLEAVQAGRCVSAAASIRMQTALDAQQIQDRLGRQLPEGARLASKTGNFADVVHDAGIVTWPGGTLVMAVLTQGFAPPWSAMDVIARIAVDLVAASA
jgi:beta-lactamase class A